MHIAYRPSPVARDTSLRRGILNEVKGKSLIANYKSSKRKIRAFKKDFTISDRRLAISEMGFTLIELLIVIAIMGILAAAILPRFVRYDMDAKCASTRGTLSSLRAAVAMYIGKTKVYPDTLADLTPVYIAFIPPEKINDSNTVENAGDDTAFENWPADGEGWVYGAYDPDATHLWGRAIRCNFTGSYDENANGSIDPWEYYTTY